MKLYFKVSKEYAAKNIMILNITFNSEIKGKFTAAIDKDKKMTTLINILNLKSILINFLEIITLRIKITK